MADDPIRSGHDLVAAVTRGDVGTVLFHDAVLWERLNAAERRVDALEAALRAARFVAEHWRDAALAMPVESQMRMMAHPLALVLLALDGETDPVQLGISPDVWDAFRAALGEQDTAADIRFSHDEDCSKHPRNR